MIEQLPRLAPDAARSHRTLARCRERLARRGVSPGRADAIRPTLARWWRKTEPVVFAGAAVAYLISMAGNVLRILR